MEQHINRLWRAWKRTPIAIRKTLVLIVGSTIIITGLVMLVLPGPGWVAIFVGISVLASEFVYFERARDWAVDQGNLIGRKVWHKIKKIFKRDR